MKRMAIGFAGALRTYSSGSIAHHTMIAPVTDGDGGVVLDRRSYPRLGPDGDGEDPRRHRTGTLRVPWPQNPQVLPARSVRHIEARARRSTSMNRSRTKTPRLTSWSR